MEMTDLEHPESDRHFFLKTNGEAPGALRGMPKLYVCRLHRSELGDGIDGNL